MTALDSLDGGAGTDVLTADLKGSVTPAALKNIEQFNFSASATSTIGLSSATTVTNVSNLGSSAALTVNNIQSTAAQLKVANVGDLNTTFTFAATKVDGTADSATLVLDSVATTTDGNGVTVNSIETLNIKTENGASTLKDLNADSATKLVITGDQDLTITDGLDADTVTVDASAFTGKLSVALTTTTATVTGGSANDTIDITAAAGTSVITLGAGNDTLVANATGTLLGTTGNDTVSGGDGTDTIKNVSAQFAILDNSTQTNITGFEVAAFTDDVGAITFDSTKISGINKVIAEEDVGAATITFATGGGTFQLGDAAGVAGDNATDALSTSFGITVDGTATTDTATFSYGSAVADSAAIAVTGTGVETLVISNSKVADTFGAVTLTGTAGATTEVKFTGSKAMTAGVITANKVTSELTGTAALTMVTTSTATTVTGGVGNDVLFGNTGSASSLTGGAGNDQITGGTGNDVVNGGDGDDTLNASSGSDNVNGGAGDDEITLGGNLTSGDTIDGGAGDDTITVSSGVTTTAIASRVSNVEVLALDTASYNQDLSLFTGTTLNEVSLTAASAVHALTNVGSTLNTISFSGATPGANSFARLTDSSANALTVKLNTGSTDTTGSTITSLTANNEETISITSAGAANVITTLAASDLRTLTVTGSKGLTIGTLTVDTDEDTADAIVFNLSASSGAISIGATANNSSIYSTNTVTAGTGALTFVGGAAADTITGGGSADSLTGAAGNDSLVGGASNDTISAGNGADYVNGGDGTDTYQSGVALSQADNGIENISGVAINLGSTAITYGALFTATGDYLNGGVTEVASNTAVYTYNAATSSGSSFVDTLVSIENATGTAGTDYIKGSSAANVIRGGDGIDTLTGGSGADTYVFESTGATNDADVITLVVADDVLDFSAFALTSGSFNTTAVAIAGTGDVATANKVTMLTGTTETALDGASEIAALMEGAGDALELASGGKAIIISGDISDATGSMFIWYVNAALDGTGADVTTADVVLVGTIATFDLDTVTAANFVL